MLPLLKVWQLLLLILLRCTLSSADFGRGGRYWNGGPQPIGIDFSYGSVIAIYAEGSSNFTFLGLAAPKPGNDYGNYIHALYSEQGQWGVESIIINDDTDFSSSSDSYESRISDWLEKFKHIACESLSSWSPIESSRRYQFFCYPEENNVPQKPRSKYRTLVAQTQRQTRLRTLMPKWFRTPEPLTPKPLTRSGFILSIYTLLIDLKSHAFTDHSINIKSATFSLPSWIHNQWVDCFEEAALLADIETFEQPRTRQEMAALTSSSKGKILVLDHGQYHFSATHLDFQERNGEAEWAQRGSMSPPDAGTAWIWRALATKIIGNFNENITEGEREWPVRVPAVDVFNQVSKARIEIKFSSSWPEDLEFANRTKALNLTDSSGFVRVLNITGRDVLDIEEKYENEIMDIIHGTVTRNDAIYSYIQSLPNYEEIAEMGWEERKALIEELIANVTPPEHVGRWQLKIDDVIILDYGIEVSILESAAEKVLGPKIQEGGTGICIPSIEIAARGAALRARKWIEYHDAWEREMYWSEEEWWDYYLIEEEEEAEKSRGYELEQEDDGQKRMATEV